MIIVDYFYFTFLFRQRTICKYVMLVMDLALKLNASNTQTEDILAFVNEIFGDFGIELQSEWPLTYHKAICTMKSSGLYSDPSEHSICFNENEHQIHWYEFESDQSCPHCDSVPDLKRYYLPLKEKIKRWVSSEEMCYAMLGHWKNRDVWLGKSGPTFPLNEIWDGERFKEIQWFFDPQAKWPLPHTCRKCDHKILFECFQLQDGEEVQLSCDKCGILILCSQYSVMGIHVILRL